MESPRTGILGPGPIQIGGECGFLGSWGETAKFSINQFCAFGHNHP